MLQFPSCEQPQSHLKATEKKLFTDSSQKLSPLTSSSSFRGASTHQVGALRRLTGHGRLALTQLLLRLAAAHRVALEDHGHRGSF